jgi:hypothetical protein
MFSQQYDNNFPTYIIFLLTFKWQNIGLFALNLSSSYFSGYSKYKNSLTLVEPLTTQLIYKGQALNRSNQVNVTPGLMLLEEK